ncbi:hypothetical protein [Sorangium sp. So ce124]|uniref:hypothetical protein n=1 Tax=Sorangium sp. So ce124 TaxID=3133280 RepID=UPI003F632EC9
MAIYVEIKIPPEADEMDDAICDGSILDHAEGTLRARGVILALTTGTRILGVALLPRAPTRDIAARADVLAAASALRRRIDDRPMAAPNIHVNVCVHAGDAAVQTTPQPVGLGGALTRLDYQKSCRERRRHRAGRDAGLPLRTRLLILPFAGRSRERARAFNARYSREGASRPLSAPLAWRGLDNHARWRWTKESPGRRRGISSCAI